MINVRTPNHTRLADILVLYQKNTKKYVRNNSNHTARTRSYN